MRPISAVMGALFVFSVGVTSAKAAVVNLGDVSNGGVYFTGTSNPTGSGNSFADYFTFNSTDPFSIDFTFLNTISNNGRSTPALTSIQYGLYSGLYNGMNSLVATITAVVDPSAPNTASGSYQSGVLSAGNYFFKASGTTQSRSIVSETINTSISVSAVPLPASLPMFGAALLALGGVAFLRGRKSSDVALTTARS